MAEATLAYKCSNAKCGKPFRMRHPGKAGVYTVTCPHCAHKFKVRVPDLPASGRQAGSQAPQAPQDAAQQQEQTSKKTKIVDRDDSSELQPHMGYLKHVRPMWRSQDFQLRRGDNIIGRADPSAPCDIAIKGDSSMSRRSIDIQVLEPVPGVLKFLLKVLKCTNPVLVNNNSYAAGSQIYLNFGDEIILGKTRLQFLKRETK